MLPVPAKSNSPQDNRRNLVPRVQLVAKAAHEVRACCQLGPLLQELGLRDAMTAEVLVSLLRTADQKQSQLGSALLLC